MSSNTTTETKELLQKYYDGLIRKEGWHSLLSDDFLLMGTVTKETRGRDLYANNNFFKLVNDLRVKELIAEGDRAFALVNYGLMSPKGKTFSCDIAEFWKVKNSRLDSIAIYFDTIAFNNFLS